MWRRGKVGGKLLGVTLISLLMALVGLLLVIQYLATRQILDWHRQRVELVARLVLAEYRGKIQRVEQAASLLADNPTYGELLASGNAEALRRLVTPLMQATGLHILTITDYQGVIQVRAHDPGALGVNISSNPLVRAGLEGKEASRMTQWKDSIALSASAPIRYENKVVGVVLTMYDKRTLISREVEAKVRDEFSDRVFSTVIPVNVRLAEAPSHHKSIFEYDSECNGAKAYRELAKEILSCPDV